MSSARSGNALETAKAINDILRLPQEDQEPLGDVISAWLDLEERDASDEETNSDDDMDGTGTYINCKQFSNCIKKRKQKALH